MLNLKRECFLLYDNFPQKHQADYIFCQCGCRTGIEKFETLGEATEKIDVEPLSSYAQSILNVLFKT